MKYALFFLLLAGLTACERPSDPNRVLDLQKRIDSLEMQLSESYKPGLGEFMSSIQVHHAKLWFAGKAQNWALADFEIEEIREALDDIPKFCADRPEVKSMPMILPALDSVVAAIQQQKPELFSSHFLLLTNTCNACHQATHHGFNVIKIPDAPPFSNQDFGGGKAK